MAAFSTAHRWLMIGCVLLAGVRAAEAQSPLLDAARNADGAAVRRALEAGADVNVRSADGTTALHWAVDADDLATTNLLLSRGAEAAAANRYGMTPLSLACLNGNAAIVQVLLEAGADPNAVTSEGETALMTAARTGKVEAVNVLLAHGADPNVQEDWREQTALMWAAAEGHAAVIRALVAAGANIGARSSQGFTALLFAAREGQIDAVQTLLDLGASLDEALPVRSNNPAAPPPVGLNAFLLAAANAHYELAALLLDRGADPNAAPRGWTALHQVSWVRKAGIAGSNNPAPEGSGGMTSLEFVRKLVGEGADVNARVTSRPPAGITSLNMIGGTPFLLAARTADSDLMRLLVELGADPLAPNADNTPPLLVAAGVGTNSPGEDPGTESEVLEAVQVALELGGDINAVDNNGETVMHGAAYKHVPVVAAFLVDNGARVEIWNRANARGWTPLNIVEGIPRGMNIVGSPATAAVIRDLMNSATTADAVDAR